MEAGYIHEHEKRKNHDDTNVADLLTVPRYADLLEEVACSADEADGSSKPQLGLVKSRDGWRREMEKWVQEERMYDSDDEELANTTYGRQRSRWLPRSLELLFRGRKEVDVDGQLRRVSRWQAYTEEACLMELLADEKEDEERIPDAGELEGFGDDFDGQWRLIKSAIFSQSLNNPLDTTSYNP
jgi:hypothetical protein